MNQSRRVLWCKRASGASVCVCTLSSLSFCSLHAKAPTLCTLFFLFLFSLSLSLSFWGRKKKKKKKTTHPLLLLLYPLCSTLDTAPGQVLYGKNNVPPSWSPRKFRISVKLPSMGFFTQRKKKFNSSTAFFFFSLFF